MSSKRPWSSVVTQGGGPTLGRWAKSPLTIFAETSMPGTGLPAGSITMPRNDWRLLTKTASGRWTSPCAVFGNGLHPGGLMAPIRSNQSIGDDFDFVTVAGRETGERVKARGIGYDVGERLNALPVVSFRDEPVESHRHTGKWFAVFKHTAGKANAGSQRYVDLFGACFVPGEIGNALDHALGGSLGIGDRECRLHVGRQSGKHETASGIGRGGFLDVGPVGVVAADNGADRRLTGRVLNEAADFQAASQLKRDRLRVALRGDRDGFSSFLEHVRITYVLVDGWIIAIDFVAKMNLTRAGDGRQAEAAIFSAHGLRRGARRFVFFVVGCGMVEHIHAGNWCASFGIDDLAGYFAGGSRISTACGLSASTTAALTWAPILGLSGSLM